MSRQAAISLVVGVLGVAVVGLLTAIVHGTEDFLPFAGSYVGVLVVLVLGTGLVGALLAHRRINRARHAAIDQPSSEIEDKKRSAPLRELVLELGNLDAVQKFLAVSFVVGGYLVAASFIYDLLIISMAIYPGRTKEIVVRTYERNTNLFPRPGQCRFAADVAFGSDYWRRVCFSKAVFDHLTENGETVVTAKRTPLGYLIVSAAPNNLVQPTRMKPRAADQGR
jgi:hypothetical protein